MKKKNENSFYAGVVEANEGIEVKDVKRLFLWYDLLSCLLPFQLIFIITYALGSKYYSLTICSLFFILITDTGIKAALEKDGAKFVKLQKQIPLVKLWVIPLALMAIATTICLLGVTFGAV